MGSAYGDVPMYICFDQEENMIDQEGFLLLVAGSVNVQWSAARNILYDQLR